MTGGELAAITIPASAVLSAGVLAHAVRWAVADFRAAVETAVEKAVAGGCKLEAGPMLRITPPTRAQLAAHSAAAAIQVPAEPAPARAGNGTGTEMSALDLVRGVG